MNSFQFWCHSIYWKFTRNILGWVSLHSEIVIPFTAIAAEMASCWFSNWKWLSNSRYKNYFCRMWMKNWSIISVTFNYNEGQRKTDLFDTFFSFSSFNIITCRLCRKYAIIMTETVRKIFLLFLYMMRRTKLTVKLNIYVYILENIVIIIIFYVSFSLSLLKKKQQKKTHAHYLIIWTSQW